MEWATFGIKYLADARKAVHEDFNWLMTEVRDHKTARGQDWYHKCKSITHTLYHYSMEFIGDGKIPGDTFSSPKAFAIKLEDYKSFVAEMLSDLDKQDVAYQQRHKVSSPAFLLEEVRRRVRETLDTINHVLDQQPKNSATSIPPALELVEKLATRFHSAVLTLKKHPHKGKTLAIEDEWDCQYLFRAILAAYFRDVRIEEWNPSVAGFSSRCEFFLKEEKIMIELKYAREASDQKKFKAALLTDFADYGANTEVSYVVALIYDPYHVLDAAVQLQKDLSGSTKGLSDVRVVISPPP